MIPPVVEADGRGCCIACLRDVRAGQYHKAGCPILVRLVEALPRKLPGKSLVEQRRRRRKHA